MIMETFETLWQYCTPNNKSVPLEWHKLHKLLLAKSDGSKSMTPYILADWGVENLTQKQYRFKEHIQWSVETEQIVENVRYLIGLSDIQWYYFYDL